MTYQRLIPLASDPVSLLQSSQKKHRLRMNMFITTNTISAWILTNGYRISEAPCMIERPLRCLESLPSVTAYCLYKGCVLGICKLYLLPQSSELPPPPSR